MNQGEILRLQVMDISQNLGFRMMRVEHGMGQEGRLPFERGRDVNIDIIVPMTFMDFLAECSERSP